MSKKNPGPPEALLEAAKTSVGTEKQKECEKLLQQVRTLAQQETEDDQSQPTIPQTSTSAYVQLILEGDLNSFDQRTRKDLVSVIAAPIIVKYSTGLNWGVIAVAVVLLGVVGWAVMKSKRDTPVMAEPVTTEADKK